MSGYLMAIDAGTGSVRAIIFSLKGGQIAQSQREWTHKEDPCYPGSMDFDVEGNWKLTVEVIKEALHLSGIRAADILAVSTTSMREGIVLYDGKGREIWACANVDARADKEVAELKSATDHIEEDIYMLSGQTFALGSLSRLLWVKKNKPDIYRNVKSISMFNDWLIYKLSGILSSEPSNGCTTGIFNIKKRQWQSGICTMCGLKDDIFPAVFEPGTVIGTISTECGLHTGLDVKTLVVTGGGDAQLGAIGAGIVSDKQTAVFGGSFWQLEYNTKAPVMDDKYRIRINCHAVPDMWQYEAISFFPGLVMRWYRDAFCMNGSGGKSGIYAEMDKKAAACPAGSYGMMCAFSNVMNYISWKHAAPTFTNFTLDSDKFNLYTFYRAIMENAALITKGHLDLVNSLTGNLPVEILFANGASKSPLWCQILADVLQIDVKVPRVKESTALGAAICAGIGAEIFSDIERACAELVHIDKTYYPDENNKSVYNELYGKWQRMYSAQLSLADEGITNYMWKAPGL